VHGRGFGIDQEISVDKYLLQFKFFFTIYIHIYQPIRQNPQNHFVDFFKTFYNINKTYAEGQKFCVPSCTFRVRDENGKKIISTLHAVDRIFGFTKIKLLSIFALFEDSDKLANIYWQQDGKSVAVTVSTGIFIYKIKEKKK
jgi:hypothetical protein